MIDLKIFRNFLQPLLIFFLIPNLIHGKNKDHDDKKPIALGNFSVPPLTQIAPLISFGQLLISEKALLPQLTGNYSQRHSSYADVIAPNIIYGILDNLSVFFSIPFTPRSRSDSSHSSGINDIFLQFEYGFYYKNC